MTTLKRIPGFPVTCVAILVLGSQTLLHAAAISIISSSVSVEGKAGANTYSGQDSGEATGTTADGTIWESTWKSTSSGSITTTGANLSTISDLIDGSGTIYNNAGYSQVTLTCRFQPLSPNITFNFTGDARWHDNESYINYTLTDLTANATVESSVWAYDFGWTQDSLPYIANLALDVGHEYELVLLARSTIGDYYEGYANLQLQIAPEPSYAALVIMGAAGMIFRRSRESA